MVKVMVPLDGSDMSDAALSYVSTLRPLGNLQLRLVAVAEDPKRYGLRNPDEWQDRQATLLREHLERKKQQLLEQDASLEVETHVRLGYPADVLLKDAQQYQPDYVIIATHGRTGMDRWRLGSVADKLIRSADWNTLAVGPETAMAPMRYNVRSIMVPLDGSSRAEEAIPVAGTLAKELGATVHLVRVVEKPLPMEDLTGYVLQALEEDAQAYLDEQAAKYSDLTPHTFLLRGNPAEALRAYVQVQGMDLVVLTSHGFGGLIRTALGSIADRMIGGSAPVLILRSKE